VVDKEGVDVNPSADVGMGGLDVDVNPSPIVDVVTVGENAKPGAVVDVGIVAVATGSLVN
jgi:hypothetical protein